MGRALAGGAAALVLLACGWLYVTHLQDANATLKARNTELAAAKAQAEKNTLAIADQLVVERDRAAKTTIIKETINAAAGGTVPDDIRAALDGLRDR